MKRRDALKLFGLTLASSGTHAQPAGGRSIRILVPLGPGTPSDSVTRILTPGMGSFLGQTAIVDNKPGANGAIAMQELIRSNPDGSTLLMGSISPLAINVALVKNLPYDPRRDLSCIGGTYIGSQAWVVKSSFPARTFAELIAHAKQNPAKVRAGHYSSLTQIQFATFNGKVPGGELLLVPYKSTSTTYTDFLGDILDLVIMDLATALTQSKGGKIRILGVTTPRRSPLAPDWPAISETIPDFDFSTWSALVGPPGMQRETVERINAALRQSQRQPEAIKKLAEGGVSPWETTPAELKTRIDTEVVKWIRLAREANIQPA
ncbi:Tripartite-type tricarboxylate transporter, receptor component TctC [Variovorax sp. YR266]|uniref:Bug family tripartite tricarboxylate transporter substrate binding protein n=1 Tax=Variovorax sp. YR266 TaxID=1884386 RepID=UPI000899B289|nr:tripartite tricarboxylate transporter substrate binding protein [Variovorax sp. YR266]SDZ70848.1 Tripartite-type tricarboxylate transporter, receptor component TctC [Variovorax sp. YR266]